MIFAAVALIAGGGGFYFLKVYQPAQQLAAAREEVTAWEARYQEARDCLLGKAPGSTKTSEALAIREMAPDPWDRGRCTPIVSKLSRGMSNDTGLESVEAAWTELDKAAQSAAIAFAKHVGSSTTLEEDPLPAALDALDAARAKLRTAATMPATEQIGTPLAPAQIIPLVDGADPVTELVIDALPSAHGVVVFGKTDNRQVQVTLTTGGTPTIARVGSGAIRAVPDPSWGATAGALVVRGSGKTQDTSGEVRVGAMDAEGAIAAPSTLAVVAPLPTAGGVFDDPAYRFAAGDQVGTISLAAVSGTLDAGTIVYGAHRTLVIARAKANTVTAPPPIKIDVATASTDVDGRIVVVWTGLDETHRALVLRDGGEDAVELPASFAGAPCLTNDRVWLAANAPEVFAFGGGRPLVRVPVAHSGGLQGCTTDAALVRGRGRAREVEICADLCRKVQLPSGAPDYATVTVVGGKLRAIGAHAGVLGVWSEDKPPVFYALPVQAKPVRGLALPPMALTDGKVIDVIARGAKAYVVIRIPAQ